MMDRRSFLKGVFGATIMVATPMRLLDHIAQLGIDDTEPCAISLVHDDGTTTTVPLASVTQWDDGTWDAADVTFIAVTGYPVTRYQISNHRGVVLADAAIPGCALTPSGGDIAIQWPTSGMMEVL